MRKILVLRGGALGDFIVTLPALALLRSRWPAADIEWVGNATAAALALRQRLLDRVHSQHEARWGALYGGAPLPPDFAAWLSEFDLVVNYWPDPGSELRRRFPIRTGQTFLSATAMPARAPAAAHYCEPLTQLGLETREFFHRFAGGGRVPSGDPRPIIVHPGSGSPRKNWPPERWLDLIARLPAPVSVVIGEAEIDRWEKVDLPVKSRLENLPLDELSGHLSACRFFLGHDSGVSHLAAACGAPCLLLFGPTDPAMWAPPAPHVRAIRHDHDLSSISLDEVLQALDAALGGRA